MYCDIIDPKIVRSNALKLLRVIPNQGKRDQKQSKWEPIRAEYLKLSKKYFDTITIQIRTPLGSPMPFISGKTIWKLHFRKIY